MPSARERIRAIRSNGVVAIAAGTGLGQLAALLAAPLLSRLFDPEQFGVMVVVTSIALTFGTIAALRLDLAIPLPSEEDDARTLVLCAAFITLLTTLVALTIVWIFQTSIVGWFGSALTVGLVCAAVGIGGIVSVYRVLNQWALRHRLYRLSARRNVLQSLTTVIVQLATGLAGWTHGLLVGVAFGQAAGAAGLIGGPSLRRGDDRTPVRSLLRRYRSFPLLLAPAGLVNAAGVYVPILMFAAFYGPTAAGVLGLAQRVLSMPMTLIGQAVAQVYLAELAESTRTASSRGRHLFWTASSRLAAVGVGLAVVLLAAAPPIFSIVFGEVWRESGEMARALSLGLAAQLVASTLSQTLVVLERTAWQVLWDVGRFLATSSAVGLSYALGASALECVWWLTIATVATYAISWDLSRRALSTWVRSRGDS